MITLQFCASPSLMGETIEWFTEGVVGHVDAVLPDGLLGAQHDAGLGGKPAGVQIRPFNYGGMTHKVRASFQVSARQEKDWEDFLRGQIGKPYDTTAILAFALGRNWRDPRAWFCSELQAAALEWVQVLKYPLLVPSSKVTPESLALICNALTPLQKIGW